MYVIIVDFEIKPDRVANFLPLMQENAAASVRDEPGCHQFDVCRDPDAPHRIFLYETCLLYTSPSPRDATLSRMPSSA